MERKAINLAIIIWRKENLIFLLLFIENFKHSKHLFSITSNRTGTVGLKHIRIPWRGGLARLLDSSCRASDSLGLRWSPRIHISYRSEVMLILMVWGPCSENHLASAMDFPHRNIKTCNRRVHTYLFLFLFFQRWAEVSTDDWRKFEFRFSWNFCLENLGKESYR